MARPDPEADRHDRDRDDAADGGGDEFAAPPSVDRPEQLETERVRAALRRRLFGVKAESPKLGRYELREQIGAGAMGAVFVARDVELRRDVALKVIRSRSSGEQERAVRRRLLREARAMAKLRHPNVIGVFEAGVIDDQAFIAMEFVDGTTLRQWHGAEPRTWQQVLDVFVPAGRGLAAAHQAGLVHRDFKPENVLIGSDGRVQVTDFGVARALEAATGDGPPSVTATATPTAGPTSRTVATEWARAGTPRYMAPEQHVGGEVDERTDQFAFCVALFEALFDEPPFQGETMAELEAAARAGKVRQPRNTRQVPRWLYRVLLRGLQPDPELRYPTMAALLVELQRARRPKRRWLGPVVLVAALAVGAYAVSQLWGPEEPAPETSTERAAGLVPAQEQASTDLARAVAEAAGAVSSAGTSAPAGAAASGPCGPTSEACLAQGRCRDVGGGQCRAGSTAHCLQSAACLQSAQCTEKDGYCVVATSADCRVSNMCKRGGLCTFERGRCVVGSDADCRGSYLCQTLGRCRRNDRGLCDQ